MKLISKIKFWILFCLAVYIYLFIRYFSYQNYRKVVSNFNENKFIKISLFICYKLELSKDECTISSDRKMPKEDFTCDFEHPISCYTKGFKDKTIKEIIGLFKKCNLTKLTRIGFFIKGDGTRTKITTKLIRNDELQLFFDQICVINTYEYTNTKNNDAKFALDTEHQLPYSVKAAVDYDTERPSSIVPVFKRFCYFNDLKKSYSCNMNGIRSLVFIKIYNFTKVNNPLSRCENYEQKNKMQLIWSCTRNRSMNHDLVYDENSELTNRKLLFRNSIPNYFKCLDRFRLPSCEQIELKLNYHTESRSKKDPFELVLTVERSYLKNDFQLLSRRVYEKWLALFCLIYGINLMKLIRLGLFSLFKMNNILFKFRYYFYIVLISFYMSLILTLEALDMININYQLYTNRQIQKPMLENDNLTIYICYEANRILKNKSETCFDYNGQCTLEQKINALWTKSDFLSKIEVKVQDEWISVDESDITEYYYHKRKCFKYKFEKPTLLVFGALIRNVFLEIKINGPRIQNLYTFGDDTYPQFDGNVNNDLIIYNKVIFNLDKAKRECIDDPMKEKGCMDERDCQYKCYVRKYAEKEKFLPDFIAINPEWLSNKEDLKLSITKLHQVRIAHKLHPECANIKFQKCKSISLIKLDNQFQNKSFIRLNLNPDLIINTKVDKNSLVANLINRLPILFIWINLSIYNLMKSVINFLKRYFSKASNLIKIINLIFFIAFLVNFKLLINLIIFEDLKVNLFSDVAERISLPKLQFCIELKDKIDLKIVNDLEKITPNASDLFMDLVFLKNDLSFEDFLDNKTKKLEKLTQNFYYKNSKCIELNLDKFFVRSDVIKMKMISSILDMTINYKKVKGDIKVYIQAYNFVTFNRPIPLIRGKFYTIVYTTIRMIKNDRFFLFKNFDAFLYYFKDKKEMRNEQKDYFR